MNRQVNWSSVLLWFIYLALLAVMLPHTAWAFSHFESPVAGWLGIRWGILSAWAAAFAFEAAIAALTHKLAKRIETTPRYSAGNVLFRRLSYQYANSFAAGLLIALVVSALANFSHAVEFGQGFAIFTEYDVSPLVYSLAFGGILPLVSLLFARILANITDGEAGSNPELTKRSRLSSDFGENWRQPKIELHWPNRRFLMPNVVSMRPAIWWHDCLLRKNVSEYWLRPNVGHDSPLRLLPSSPKPRLAMYPKF